MLRLQLDRSVRPAGKKCDAPKLRDHVETYFQDVTPQKRPRTIALEKIHIEHWVKFMGDTQLDKITKGQILRFRSLKQQAGWTGRTANLAVTILRNLLNHALDNELIASLPTDGLRSIRWVPKKRSLVTGEQMANLCKAALEHCPLNGRALADYLKLMSLCGSRRNETLAIQWKNIDWDRRQLIIGADGQTKNHESRCVDFNEPLDAHLKDMLSRKQEGTKFLFPAFRGEGDAAKSFRESLAVARKRAGLPHFGFHDCRHHFISYCVMSGIDYMTIARWVGHKDGGVLIGRVYGHLSNEHAQRQAQRVRFGLAG